MKFNPKIKEVLKQYDIPYDDAMGYLLALYYGHRPTYIPDTLRMKVNATKIVEGNAKEGYKWNISMFEGQETTFLWVETEYVPLFKQANSERGGKVRESTKRMKRFFAENPQYRKDDVLEAVRMYLNNTNTQYVMFPHYFIEKGVGVAKTFTLLEWLDKLELSKTVEQERTSTQITMQ